MPAIDLNSYKALVRRNWQANLLLLGRAGELMRRGASVQAGSEPVGANDVRALVDDWTRLNLSFYSQLNEQNLRYLNSVVSSAGTRPAAAPASTPIPAATKPAATPAPKAAGIVLGGRRGEVLRTAFQLENGTALPASVSFELQDFVSASGAKAGAACLSIDPAATVLEPGAERLVRIAVRLGDEFKPGQSYDSTIRVVGFPNKMIRLRVDVSADPAVASAPAKVSRRPKRAAAASARRSAKKKSVKKVGKRADDAEIEPRV